MAEPLKLVVFDCDGTLVDSQHMIVEAMRRAFTVHRLGDPDPEQVRRVVGLSLVQAVAGLLPDADPADHHSVAEAYKAAFFDLRTSGVLGPEPLFDGVRDALHALEDAGYVMGIATGKSVRGLEATLKHHDIRHLFVTTQTADHHPSKPHPSMVHTAIAEAGADPAATVVVGDTSYDMKMARTAGAHALGVAWGYHPADELTAAGAHGICHIGDRLPAEISALLERSVCHD